MPGARPRRSRRSSTSSTLDGSGSAAASRARASTCAPWRRPDMDATIRTKRIFVAGQLVEYWENPDVPFGWTPGAVQDYVDRNDWTLLFNALVLSAPRPGDEAQ